MARDHHTGPAQNNEINKQVATGGNAAIGFPTYAGAALRLFDNGYLPIPIIRHLKRPAVARWSAIPIDLVQVERWAAEHRDCGIGLRTGTLVGIDIDILDPDIAHQMGALVEARLGATLMRVGLWPKRLYLYRTEQPFAKMAVDKVEVLGLGQQFVAFGVHPATKQPYYWPNGEGPLDVPFAELPLVNEAACRAVLAELSAFMPSNSGPERRRTRPHEHPPAQGPQRNTDGLVVDGRDGWLSSAAFHAVHDAVDRGGDIDPDALAAQVWHQFAASTDLERARQDGGHVWDFADAVRKVENKLALLANGRLPERKRPNAALTDPVPGLAPEVARAQLEDAIEAALHDASEWWSGDQQTAPPVMGIRATVGLGKSAISRNRIAAWQRDMQAQGLPHRVLVVTPSHALAEEAASAWAAQINGKVAVLRGYNGTDPSSGTPMCHDNEMVKLALYESLSIGKSVCFSSKLWICAHYHSCLKQQNKRDVAEGSVVLAPYDVLFTGPAAGSEPFALIVIDEGCWQRSVHDLKLPPIELMATAGLIGGLIPSDPDTMALLADLAALRRSSAAALAANGAGAVRAEVLREAGLTSEICNEAISLEERCLQDPKIYPGMKLRARKTANAIVRHNETVRRMIALWHSLASILMNDPSARVLRVHAPDAETGRRKVTLHGHLGLMESLKAVPILHLDATLRPELAKVLLPDLSMTHIEATQTNQTVTLVTGRFGKSSLCPVAQLEPEELKRRQNRLREVVDYVRWQAMRKAGKPTLVVTYKAIEDAFHGIKGIETAHFNAIAGLDRFGSVGLLIVIGRPLPSSEELGPLCASLFKHLPEGRYEADLRAVRLRSGSSAAVRTLSHRDAEAELLRAAICDDEILQSVGRGRGVNRTADNPLEVQVLADVALPLVHDQVLAWETVKPDILQRMLLCGIASDSPVDAAALHPRLFSSADMAESRFRRSGFNRQNPMSNLYREMTVKSARYRRGGKGRSWQRVWWIDGSSADALTKLISVLGPIEGWQAQD